MNNTWVWVGIGVIAIGVLALIGNGYTFITPTPAPAGHQLTPASTTLDTATTTPEPPPPRYALGKPQIFKQGYQKIFTGDLIVTMVEQTDSRCKPGTQCIWAGELGIQLGIVGGGIDPGQTIYLGQTTKKSVAVLPYVFTLNAVNETQAIVTVTRSSSDVSATTTKVRE